MVIGAYYLTEAVDGATGEGRVFRHLYERRAGLRGGRPVAARQGQSAGQHGDGADG